MTVRKVELVPKPLASWNSRTLRMREQLFRECPEYEWGTAADALLAVDLMNEAAVSLAREIPVNVCAELRALLQELSVRWASITEMVWAYSALDQPWQESMLDAAPHGFRPDLVQLVRLTLDEHPRLRAWCELGGALGAYYRQTRELLTEGPPPPLCPLVEASRAVPEEDRAAVPELRRLAALPPDNSQGSPRDTLQQVVGPSGGGYEYK
jgi:hypothetical protein